MTRLRLFGSLAFVLAGLLGRALIDKLLAAQGGPLAVAAWAQLSSFVDLVAGASLAGVGTGLTVLAAAGPDRLRWLKPALFVGLGVSLAVAAIGLPWGLMGGSRDLLPGDAGLVPLALLAGGLAVGPGLLVAWFLGTGHPGRATAVVGLGFLPPLAGLLWSGAVSPQGSLLAAQAAFGLVVSAGLAVFLHGQPPASKETLAAVLRFVPAGLAIGILGPAALAWARAEMAGNLSWQAVGQIQALWRASDWITLLMAGVLNAHYLPRLSAARDGPAFRAELGQAVAYVMLPTALLLAGLWLVLPEALAILYSKDLGLSRGDAVFFLMGDGIRVLSWIALIGLFARRAAWAITLGEFLSLPLFAALLTLLAGRYGLREAGMIWLATYTAYATFNGAALGWSMGKGEGAWEAALPESPAKGSQEA